MRKIPLALGTLLCAAAVYAAPPAEANAGTNWEAAVTSEMPLLGHRNWILIVDSAYPLQVTPGIQTVETGEPMLAVARFVLGAVKQSIHVRPDIFMDAELPFVPDQDAPGTHPHTAVRSATCSAVTRSHRSRTKSFSPKSHKPATPFMFWC
jgi:hypothetical protein